MSSKAWGGRFQQQPEDWVDEFNASIDFDQTLLDEDVQGSIAHATMLANQNIISQDDKDAIINGLKEIQQDFHNGKLAFNVSVTLEVSCIQVVVEMTKWLLTCIYT